MNREPKILDVNGAKVVLYPILGLKAVGVEVMIKAGSWYEQGELWGRAHLLEHMMFQGSEKFSNREAMEEFKEEYGIYSNAYTGGAMVSVVMRFPGENLLQAMTLLKETLFGLTIPQKALKKQKEVVRQEFEDRISRPSARFWEAAVKHIFGNSHKYTRDGIGKKEAFMEVTREELLAYMKKQIVNENMVVAVAGNIVEEEVVKVLEKVLVGNGQKAVLEIEEPEPKSGRLVHLEEGMTSAKVELNFETEGIDKTNVEKRLILGLASYLLGGSTRSVLFKEIREKLGLAYGISSGVNYYPNTGRFYIETSVEKGKEDDVIGEIRRVVAEFCERKIENEVFARAKKYLIAQKEMRYESASGTAGSLADSLFWYGEIVGVEKYKTILSKVGEEEVRKLIRKIVLEQEGAELVMRSK